MICLVRVIFYEGIPDWLPSVNRSRSEIFPAVGATFFSLLLKHCSYLPPQSVFIRLSWYGYYGDMGMRIILSMLEAGDFDGAAVMW